MAGPSIIQISRRTAAERCRGHGGEDAGRPGPNRPLSPPSPRARPPGWGGSFSLSFPPPRTSPRRVRTAGGGWKERSALPGKLVGELKRAGNKPAAAALRGAASGAEPGAGAGRRG